MKRISEFIKSVLAGVMIAIGGTVFLSCENKYVGAFLFSVGLITVVLFKMNLYTGRIGYVLDNGGTFFADTVLSVLGNAVGCLIIGLLQSPKGQVAAVVENKLEKPVGNLLVDAALCGVLIFVCVDIYKKHNKLIGILFCIPTFILCGFEHSVADMFYVFNAREFSLEAVVMIALVVVGNAVGGLFIPVLQKISGALEK